MFGSRKEYYGTIDTTVGRTIGNFARGYVIGYAVTTLLNLALDAKKAKYMQDVMEQDSLDFSEYEDDDYQMEDPFRNAKNVRRIKNPWK